MDKKEFESLLMTKTAVEVVQGSLFDMFPYCFSGEPEHYELFRRTICEFFDIHPQNFAIAGSAQTGFSLAPETYGRPFGKGSDIDVVLVSEDLFQEIWLTLIEYRRRTYTSLDPYFRKKFNEMQYIFFNGIVRFDKLGDSFAFAKKWWQFFNTLSVDPTFGPRRVRASLFKSWSHVTFYYADGFQKL